MHAVYYGPTNSSPDALGTLGPVPGAPCGFSDAYAINDKGQIAGMSLRYDTNSMSVVQAAVLWQYNHNTNGTPFWEITDLNDQLVDKRWYLLNTVGVNNDGLLLARANNAAGEKRALLLLPMKLLMWETFNPANRVFNPTPKDDLPAAFSNKLYVVESPADSQYHVTLEMRDLPTYIRSKLMYAVYDGSTKLKDGFFPLSAPADIVFDHPPRPTPPLINSKDFELLVGYDSNGNNSFDANERIVVAVTDEAGNVIGPPIVKGFDIDSYTACDITLSIGTALEMHAAALLRVFMDGHPSCLDFSKRPTLAVTTNFNCFTDPFCVWLTHNAGAPFDAAGTARIRYYTWGTNTSLAKLVCNAHQFKQAARAFYSNSVLPAAAAFFADKLPGTLATFPLDGSWYRIPLSNESPAWVDKYLPGVTVTLSSEERKPGWNALTDDLFATVARGRVLEFKAKFTVEKKVDDLGRENLEVTGAHFAGVVEDLYDFSGEDGLPGIMAAIVQLGHGNGSYGSTRETGVIFRDRIEFDQSVENPLKP